MMSASKKTSKRIDIKMTAAGGVIGLVLAYAFVSRAFSTGSYWHYLGCVVFLFLGVKLLVKAYNLRNVKRNS